MAEESAAAKSSSQRTGLSALRAAGGACAVLAVAALCSGRAPDENEAERLRAEVAHLQSQVAELRRSPWAGFDSAVDASAGSIREPLWAARRLSEAGSETTAQEPRRLSEVGSETTAEEPCMTSGGGAGAGLQCTFPFTYHGHVYAGCTEVDSPDVPWCAVMLDQYGKMVREAWGKCADSCPKDTAHTKVDNSAELMVNNVSRVKYRVKNVRHVFLTIAWIAMILYFVQVVRDINMNWYFPQYQALHAQLNFLLLLLALPPSLSLYIGNGFWWSDVLEVLFEGHLLLIASVWLPRLLDKIVSTVKAREYASKRAGAGLVAQEALSHSLQFKPEGGRLLEFDIGGHHEIPLGDFTDNYVVVTASMLLYIVRPVTRALFVSNWFGYSFPADPLRSRLIASFLDFVMVLTAVLLCRIAGKRLLESVPHEFKKDRFNFAAVQSLVLLPPLTDMLLLLISPSLTLATELSQLIHICQVALAIGILSATQDVTSYMSEMVQVTLGEDSGEIYVTKRQKVMMVLDPLLAFHSITLTRDAFHSICDSIAACLELENSIAKDWPFQAIGTGVNKVKQPLLPYELTPSEEDLDAEGLLHRRNEWPFVFGDLFSVRVRSSYITSLIIVLIVTLWIFKWEMGLTDLNNWQVLGLQMLFGVFVWLFGGFLLLGNNVFLPKNAYKLWSVMWIALLSFMYYLHLSRFLYPHQLTSNEHIGILIQVMCGVWMHLVLAILCAFLIIMVMMRFRLHDNASDYIVQEMRNLLYTRVMLRREQMLNFPKVGDIVQFVTAKTGHQTREKAEVLANFGDGYYQVQNLVGKKEKWNVLRKTLCPVETDEKDEPVYNKYDRQDHLTCNKYVRKSLKEPARRAFQRFFKKLTPALPPVLLVSATISVVVVTAFSAVAGDTSTQVFALLQQLQRIATVGDAYVRLGADCDITGVSLARIVDVDESQTVSHDELPLYQLLSSMPKFAKDKLISDDDHGQTLWPTDKRHDLQYSDVSTILCQLERATKLNLNALGGIHHLVQAAKNVSLTGDMLIHFFNGSISKEDAQDTIDENIAVMSPGLATLSGNVLDVVWNSFDKDHSGHLNGTEADTIALGLNYLVGRAPILLGLMPCPYDGGRRLGVPGVVTPVAQLMRLSDRNRDDLLDRKEWQMVVATIIWLPGLSWGKMWLMKAFDVLAGDARQLHWEGIMRLAKVADAFIYAGMKLPTILKTGELTAQYFMPFLDENGNGELTPPELKSVESYLAESQTAVRAEAMLERAFIAADANRDGKLAGDELKSNSFGASLLSSLGDFAVQEMQKAVASTPANCKKRTEEAPSKSFVQSVMGRLLMDAPPRASREYDNEQDIEHDVENDDVEVARKRWRDHAGRYLLASAGIWNQVVWHTPRRFGIAGRLHAQMTDAKAGISAFFHFAGRASDEARSVAGQNEAFTESLLRYAGCEKVRNTIWLMTIGTVVANVLSDLFVIVILAQLLFTYQKMMRYFRRGTAYVKKDSNGKVKFPGMVQGSSLVDAWFAGGLRNSFSSSSYLPGTMWFTIIVSWLLCFLGTLGAWASIISGYYWGLQLTMMLAPYATYLASSILIVIVLRYGFVDQESCLGLVNNGDIIRPSLWTPFWIMLVVINFVIGITLAIIRIAILLGYALVSTCFLHYSLLPERGGLIRLDTGYYGFLAMTYTWYERHSPIKKAFNSVAFPQVHRLYGRSKDAPTEEEGYEKMSERDGAAARQQRAKNRFNLILTLWRNPDLIQCRNREKHEEECSELTSEFDESSVGTYTDADSVREDKRTLCGTC